MQKDDATRWCLVAAIAAIGMKTQLKELATVGIKPIVLMIGETFFLALLVLGLLRGGLKAQTRHRARSLP
jgi:uncharacterized membrane protein YadS